MTLREGMAETKSLIFGGYSVFDPAKLLRMLDALERMEVALRMLHDETEDYVVLNNLGDPHHNQSMKMARAALRAMEE